jgi:hypothetical protein
MGAKSEFAFFKRPRGRLKKEKIRGNFPLKKPQKTKSSKCVKFTKTKKQRQSKKTLLCLENPLKCKLN